MKPHSASSRSSNRVPDLKLSTVHPRAVPSLRLREAHAFSHAEKIIEASQDLTNLGVSVLGSNDDATLLAEVRWQGAGMQSGIPILLACLVLIFMIFSTSSMMR